MQNYLVIHGRWMKYLILGVAVSTFAVAFRLVGCQIGDAAINVIILSAFLAATCILMPRN